MNKKKSKQGSVGTRKESLEITGKTQPTKADIISDNKDEIEHDHDNLILSNRVAHQKKNTNDHPTSEFEDYDDHVDWKDKDENINKNKSNGKTKDQ
jgi:hypothetical protein